MKDTRCNRDVCLAPTTALRQTGQGGVLRRHASGYSTSARIDVHACPKKAYFGVQELDIWKLFVLNMGKGRIVSVGEALPIRHGIPF